MKSAYRISGEFDIYSKLIRNTEFSPASQISMAFLGLRGLVGSQPALAAIAHIDTSARSADVLIAEGRGEQPRPRAAPELTEP
jgi:hypothetical protein